MGQGAAVVLDFHEKMQVGTEEPQTQGVSCVITPLSNEGFHRPQTGLPGSLRIQSVAQLIFLVALRPCHLRRQSPKYMGSIGGLLER